jgi:hypothetical protein
VNQEFSLTQHASRLGVIAALLIAGTVSVSACSVPVFRYALEHWTPDTYEALVFHRGPMSAKTRSLIDKMKSDQTKAPTNVSVRTIDLDTEDAAKWLPVWDSFEGNTLPWLAIRPALHLGFQRLMISEPLTETSVERLIDSPARREYISRLTKGHSAVWLLLESGDAKADDAAEAVLKERVAYLGSVLKLPELSEEDIANGLISISGSELKLEFSLMRVSRKDPKESAFVKMLLGVEDDLQDLKAPMIFPLFGQGRALYALVGAGINNETIDAAAIFLSGKCSCQVKEQNPGVDLLMSANWPEIATPGKGKSTASEVTPAPTVRHAEIPEPEIVKISGSVEEPQHAPADTSDSAPVGTNPIIPVAVLIAGLLFVFRRP